MPLAMTAGFVVPLAPARAAWTVAGVRFGASSRRRLRLCACGQPAPAAVGEPAAIPASRLLKLSAFDAPERRRASRPPPSGERRRPVRQEAVRANLPAIQLAAPVRSPAHPAKWLIKAGAIAAIAVAWGLFYLSLKALFSPGGRIAAAPDTAIVGEASAAPSVARPDNGVL